MTVMLSILIAAAIAFGVARWWRLPAVPLLVLTGLGLRTTGFLGDDEQFLRDTLLLGLAFLVFVAGTELSPTRVGPQRRAATLVGLVQFFGVAVAGSGAALALGFAWQTALYVGLALTASSTLVVVMLLRQRQQFFEPFGRLVLGVLLLQDVLVIIAIGGLAGVDEGTATVLRGLAGTFLLIGLSWVCIQWITPWLLLRLKLDEEGLLLVVLAMLFAFMGASNMLGVPMVVGAFLAGVAMSGFPSNGVVRGQVSSLADFFTAVFFVGLGASLVWLEPLELALSAMLVAMVVVLTPPLVAWIARRSGMSSRAAIESGLLLTQCSEFSLIVALLGVEQGHVDENLFAMVALVTVATMILTPFIATDRVTWWLMRLRAHRPHFGERREERPSGHVLLLGCGNNIRPLLDQLIAAGERVVVVDDDAGVVASLRARGVEALRGDGADFFLLRDVGARAAKLIVSTMRRTTDNERLLRFTWEANVPVLARTFGPEAAERLAVLGATPIIESEAAAEAALAWFDGRFRHTTRDAAAVDSPPAKG